MLFGLKVETDAHLFPAGNYMLKVNNRNTTTRCEICSKLTKKIPERRQAYFTPCASVSIVNFEQVNAGWSSVSIVNFEQVNASWEDYQKYDKSILYKVYFFHEASRSIYCSTNSISHKQLH